jgi:hypothetical protein
MNFGNVTNYFLDFSEMCGRAGLDLDLFSKNHLRKNSAQPLRAVEIWIEKRVCAKAPEGCPHLFLIYIFVETAAFEHQNRLFVVMPDLIRYPEFTVLKVNSGWRIKSHCCPE